jgi:filamentous hemagglutinin family protein
LLLVVSALFTISQAQITLDGSLGPRGPVVGPNYVIDATVGQLRGSNLFHSFGEFSVQTGESATFTGPNTIANVLGRVTGGNPSFIDGRIRSTISQANLYLLNPAGVVFGPNASLDVKGSFYVSTADFLRLADGATFSADLSANSVLTVAPPVAFGFLRGNPAGISMQGSALRVPVGETLSVVGGDVAVVGGVLQAPSGQVHIASVASPGEVVSSTSDQTPAVNVDRFERLGAIALSNAASIDVSGGGGGGVVIRGGVLTLAEGTQINSFANPFGGGRGADVSVAVGRLEVRDGSQINTTSGFFSAGGNVTIKATEAVSLAGSDSTGSLLSSIATLSLGGEAGRIVIEAPTATLTLDGGALVSFSVSEIGGKAGDIRVAAERVIFKNGGLVGNLSTGGPAGTIEVTASDTVSISGQNSRGTSSGVVSFSLAGDPGELLIQAPTLVLDGGAIGAPSLLQTAASGHGGTVTIEVGTLTATHGAVITSSTITAGAAGDVTVRATDAVTLAGGSQISTTALGTGDAVGDAGDILVQARNITLTDGSQINSSTFGAGQGGMMTVTATDSMFIAGRASDGFRSGLFSTTSGSGAAGNMTVSATALAMEDGRIQTTTTGDGQAGDLRIDVGRLVLRGGAQLSSSSGEQDTEGHIFAGNGQGGNLTVTARDTMAISGQSSDGFQSGFFSTSDGAGNAGNLFISAPVLRLDDGGRIVARTLGDGNAGNIDLQTGRLELSGGAQIFSGTGNVVVIDGVPTFTGTGGPGRGGNLTIRATDSLSITGQDQAGFQSGLFSNAQVGTGRAGDLFVATPRLTMQGGLILASSERPSSGDAGVLTLEVGQLVLTEGAQISGSTHGTGQGGTVTVRALDSVSISGQGSGLFTTAESSGEGGNIVLQTRNLQLTDGAVISAQSSGTGNAGSLSITATEAFHSTSSTVTTEATEADGGDIRVTAQDIIRLRDSEITATVGGGPQTVGGNVTIDPEFVILQHSRIIANAFEGQGGNIRITAGVFLADPASGVSASSDLGIDGVVDIQAPVTNLSGTVAPLPQTFVQAAALLREPCAERMQGGEMSSFMLAGRDGLPLQPGSMLPSPPWRPAGSAVSGSEAGQAHRSAVRAGLLVLDDNGQPHLSGWHASGFPQGGQDGLGMLLQCR